MEGLDSLRLERGLGKAWNGFGQEKEGILGADDFRERGSLLGIGFIQVIGVW